MTTKTDVSTKNAIGTFFCFKLCSKRRYSGLKAKDVMWRMKNTENFMTWSAWKKSVISSTKSPEIWNAPPWLPKKAAKVAIFAIGSFCVIFYSHRFETGTKRNVILMNGSTFTASERSMAILKTLTKSSLLDRTENMTWNLGFERASRSFGWRNPIRLRSWRYRRRIRSSEVWTFVFRMSGNL